MPKNDTRQGKPAKAGAASTRPRTVIAERRVRSPAEFAETPTPTRPTRAAALRLAAEVERLELELAAARNEIVALAAHVDTDALTGVLNRRGFERELKRSLAYLKRYDTTSAALLFVDLDRFKTINDSHGHAAGDAVLRAVAKVISRQVRASDLVARLGGDEFVVLLWNLTAADAQAKAEVIEAAIARTTATHAGARLSIGASVGSAPLLPLDTPTSVLERADAAMYARKAARGRRSTAG